MIFDRQKLLEALKLAKLAVHSQGFIPVHACFCFANGQVYGYNNTIAVKVPLESKLQLGVEADALFKILNSLSADTVEIAEEGTSHVKVKAKRTNLKMPITSAADFQLKWPNVEQSSFSIKFSDAQLEQFFGGLKSCLSSIGDSTQSPAQKGITVTKGDLALSFYSTNNRAISCYVAAGKWIGVELTNVILPTAFCKIALTLRQAFKDDDVSWIVALDKKVPFAILDFGGRCQLFGKLVANPSPIEFDSTIEKHIAGSKTSQKIVSRLGQAFSRAAILLASETRKSVKVTVEGKEVRIQAESRIGTLDEKCVFPEEWPDLPEFWVDSDLVRAALDSEPASIGFSKTAIAFKSLNYLHLVGTSTTKLA